MFLRNRARPVLKVNNLAAVCEDHVGRKEIQL
jgi:hypothetical protein